MTFLAVWFLLSAGRASAFQAAGSRQLRELRRSIEEASRLQEEVLVARAALIDERRAIDPKRERLSFHYSKLGPLMKASREAHEKAIRLAVEAYAIAPPEPESINRDRQTPFGGISVRWSIEFRDDSFEYQVAAADGKLRSGTYNTAGFFGIAFPDGAIFISPSAFQSPAFLAAVLLHERVHYDQAVAPDGPNGHRPDFEMREVYARQAVLARRELLGLSHAEFKALDDDLSHRHRRLTYAPWSMGLRNAFESHRASGEERLSHLVTDWAAECGLTWTGSARPIFTHKRLGREKVDFRYADADGARAAFMVVGACLEPDAPSPCLDAVDALDVNWGDPDFRESLLLAQGSADSTVECVRYFVDNYRPGEGFASVRRALAGYRRALDDAAEASRLEFQRARRAEAEAERRHKADREQDERDRFNDRQMRSGGGGPDKEWSEELQRWIVPAR